MNVYGKAALDEITVRRWVKRVNSKSIEKGGTNLSDKPCGARLAAAGNKVITAEKQITITKL